MDESQASGRAPRVKHAHVVPRFYLTLFAREVVKDRKPYLEVAQIDQQALAGSATRSIAVGDAGVRKNFYSSTDTPDAVSFETVLAGFENATAQAVRDLNNHPFDIGTLQWRQIALFVACQQLRSPVMRWALGAFEQNFSQMAPSARKELEERYARFTDELVPDHADTQARVFTRFLGSQTMMIHSMTANIIILKDEAMLTADAPVFVGQVEDRFAHPGSLPIWYLTPISRRVALLLMPPGGRDQVIEGNQVLADKICCAMLRMARPPDPSPGGPAIKWGYGYRHPDDDHLDRLLKHDDDYLEQQALDIPRYSRMPGGHRLVINR